MGFNKFILNIIVRSILIALNALAIAFTYNLPEWIFTFLFVCVLFILQIYLIIKYLSKINKDLANFLIHIKEQNSTLKFPEHFISKTFGNLTSELEKINVEIREINKDKIKKQNLLNQLLNQVGTGILVIDSSNKTKLYNKALIQLFDLSDFDKNQLNEKILSFTQDFEKLQAGNQSIETIQINNITRRILIALSEIREDNEIFKIYSFHDIDREMTNYELQSWNGLIKVLSHEIMNTLTPISTVVDTIKDCLTTENRTKSLTELNEKDISDSLKGSELIDNRIKGLSNIITQFRQFSELTSPILEEIRINDLLKNTIDIYKLNYPNVRFIIEINPLDLSINIDKQLIELCINNIIKNAIEASFETKQAKVLIKAFNANTHTQIEFYNNGKGIDASTLKKVFLPFFTTKENGSGIGLSLARQIMFSHDGDIEISSNKNETCVRLTFS